MEAGILGTSITSAIRYWEPRRLIYNAVLAAIVLVYFVLGYPASRRGLIVHAQFIFVLAVLANVAYCAAYPVDIFAQASGYRDRWLKYRWVVFAIGLLFAGVLTHFWAAGIFARGSS